jgi:phenylacetate-CoA ligase
VNKVEHFLHRVNDTNSFYRGITKENNIVNIERISEYPVLTRQLLQENRYNIFSDGNTSKYYYQQLRRQTSSGSSGIPVNVYWDYKDYYSSTLILWRKRLKYYGIHPNDRCVMFTLNAFNVKSNNDALYYKNEPENILNINIPLIHQDNNFEKLIELINNFHPKWLYIQPTVLSKLLSLYHNSDVAQPSSLEYIESVGELLLPDLRRRATEFFRVPIANMYGSEEMNGIAFECPHHKMHVLEENVYVECKDDAGIHRFGEGEAIVTSLTNNAMPLIRYNQGDIIILERLTERCECNYSSLIIRSIKGRSYNSTITSEGNVEINTFALFESIAEVNNQYRDIVTCYKYIYVKSENRLKCLVSIDPKRHSWFVNVSNAIESIIFSKLPRAVNIKFEVSMEADLFSFEKKFETIEIIN